VLQIATGKLFISERWRENHLRAPLYTNACLDREAHIDTAFGNVTPCSSYAVRPHVWVYDFIERMEEIDKKPGVLISRTVDPYAQDFSAVVSFALNCVCAPDVDTVRRLISGQRGLVTGVSPPKMVHRFFDETVYCHADDIAFLTTFTTQLEGLHRKTFLEVMRAVRTWVNGMHRISDDLALAYALLVASVESLAQTFDGYTSDWESVEERKRQAIDASLADAPPELVQRVRDAIVAHEHLALGRRFREFSFAHTPTALFRSGSHPGGQRLARSDLTEALRRAYEARSAYVHRLRRLPDALTMDFGFSDVATARRGTHLTLQGLSRVMRSVIIEFVMRQPTIAREPYNYQLEQSGVVQMEMSPELWIWQAEGDIQPWGRVKLEGFLQQLEALQLKRPNAGISDFRLVLERASTFVGGQEERLRRPYLALHVLFNRYLVPEFSVPISDEVRRLIQNDLAKPSPESLIAHLLTDQPIAWDIDTHQQTFDGYLRRREASNGIRFPRTYEAALALDLAERYRQAGHQGPSATMIGWAMDNCPGHGGLTAWHGAHAPSAPIRWTDILLPPPEGAPTTDMAAS